MTSTRIADWSSSIWGAHRREHLEVRGRAFVDLVGVGADRHDVVAAGKGVEAFGAHVSMQ
jgi:hypothetical protein